MRASDRHLARLPKRDATWHSSIVAAVVASYKEPVYLEIGVHEGATFAKAAPFSAQAFAVDVDMSKLAFNVHQIVVADHTSIALEEMSSDQFFAHYEGPKPDVIFIDGDHSFEQSSRDAQEALLILADGGTLILHDTWPMLPDDTDERICGEVHRTADLLQRDRELAVFTVQRFPGLTFVNRRCVPSGAPF